MLQENGETHLAGVTSRRSHGRAYFITNRRYYVELVSAESKLIGDK